MVSNSLGPFLALASAARAASAGTGNAGESVPATDKPATGTTGTPGSSPAYNACRMSTFESCGLPAALQEVLAAHKGRHLTSSMRRQPDIHYADWDHASDVITVGHVGC